MKPLHEDAFVVGNDGWITLPDGGRVSPEGVVYDADGNKLYTVYEDDSQIVDWANE